MKLTPFGDLIEAFRCGAPVVLVEEDSPEAQGSVVLPADAVSEQHVNFMARHARGLVCLALTEARCAHLALPLMAETSRQRERYTVSIEARTGVNTGISAADRARTIQVAVAADATARDLVQPGHVFPIQAQDDGVLRRSGFAEAGVDLARMAGRVPAAVLAAILDDEGEVARGEQLAQFALVHRLPIGSIAELIHYRMLTEGATHAGAASEIDTRHGRFKLIAYRDDPIGAVHLALVRGQVRGDAPVLVRVQAIETLRDVLQSEARNGPCDWNVDRSLAAIAEQGCGALLLLARQETVGDVLSDIAHRAEAPQARAPHFAARGNGVGARILHELGIRRLRVMSQPAPYRSIAGFDLEVVEFVPYRIDPNAPSTTHQRITP